MIHLKYFTFDYLNRKIALFPYQHTDKVDRPQLIPKTFTYKGTIGGMDMRVMVHGQFWWTWKKSGRIGLCPVFTYETIEYLQCKISDHRQILKEIFPEYRLRHKHHHVEHYPNLKCFGPLVHLWTMRFEGKYCFFKSIVHDTQNFKNILKTLASRHEYLMAYLSPPFFHTTDPNMSILVSPLHWGRDDYQHNLHYIEGHRWWHRLCPWFVCVSWSRWGGCLSSAKLLTCRW